MDSNIYNEQYLRYYINLENDFLNLDRFVALDKDNYKCFSLEFVKLYQLICSEIDNICKVLCKELDSNFNGETIPYYCMTILNNYSDFITQTIKVKFINEEIIPWDKWSFKISEDKNGKMKVTGVSPEWWVLHNKVKHNRTKIYKTKTSYKYANLKNVLYSLAALYQLIVYLSKHIDNGEREIALNESKLFTLKNWKRTVHSASSVILYATKPHTLNIETKEDY